MAQRQGASTAVCISHHPTLLPTWAPVGREGASSDTYAGRTGNTCLLPDPTMLELRFNISVLWGKGEVGVP